MSLKLKINNADKNIYSLLAHDSKGNIYFTVNDETYTIWIDKKNDITFEKVKKDIDSEAVKVKYGKIDNLTKGLNLKAKVIDEAIEEDDHEIEDDEEENSRRNYYKLYPEDKYYNVDHEEFNDEDKSSDDVPICYDAEMLYDDSNYFESHDGDLNGEYFRFYGLCDVSSKILPLSIYDTFIYNGDETSNNLVFKSELVNDTSNYRIYIYTLGKIRINIIGSEQKIFNICYDDKLFAQQIKSHTVSLK